MLHFHGVEYFEQGFLVSFGCEYILQRQEQLSLVPLEVVHLVLKLVKELLLQ